MKDIRELLQTRPLLFDGAMGTYYKAAPGVECEQANLTDPAGVLAVHREYLAAGADAVKTNTFSLPRLAAAHAPGWEQLAQAGWQLAVQAAEETGAAVFADLGPAPDTEAVPAGQVYTAVAKQFAALGARNFLFETLSSDAGLLNAVGAIKAEVPDAFVLVSFAVLSDGYTREGMYCKDLARRMQEKLWQALYYRYDFAKEYRPQLEENLLWLDGELKKLEGMQMRHRTIEKSDR